MLEIEIPGFDKLTLAYLLLDYNGTLAVAGSLIMEVKPLLSALSAHLQIHIITGDTYGKAKAELEDVNCQLTILPMVDQAIAKERYLQQLNPHATVAIGNGRNDRYMLKKARLSIAVLGDEGAAIEALLASDIVCPNIFSALALLNEPRRLVATLRS